MKKRLICVLTVSLCMLYFILSPKALARKPQRPLLSLIKKLCWKISVGGNITLSTIFPYRENIEVSLIWGWVGNNI